MIQTNKVCRTNKWEQPFNVHQEITVQHRKLLHYQHDNLEAEVCIWKTDTVLRPEWKGWGKFTFFIHSNFFRQQMHSLFKYKMLQLTFKISLCGLLHVSVRSDHHQGAYAEPHWSYSICGIISKNTSLKMCCAMAVCVSGCSVYWVLCSVWLQSHTAQHLVHTLPPEAHTATTQQHF
jgi:hypothetical protein